MTRLALLTSLLALAGCARDDGEAELPAACKSSPLAALESAPGRVRLDGVPISACLAHDATVGDVQLVGSVLLDAAQKLGEEGDSVGLGYLVGAARRGAALSQGIHLEVVRRLEQEAAPFSDSPGYERGLRAGRTSG